jgi:hypothetical protein
VLALELDVRDVVARRPEVRNDHAARSVDRQRLVLAAVRNEDVGPPPAFRVDDEPRRRADHEGEQIPVREPDGERVRRAVGEPRERDGVRIHGDPLERRRERRVDHLDVGPERAFDDDVPRRPSRQREQHRDAALGRLAEPSEAAVAATARTVQRHHERHRPSQRLPRNEQRRVTVGHDAERLQTRLDA